MTVVQLCPQSSGEILWESWGHTNSGFVSTNRLQARVLWPTTTFFQGYQKQQMMNGLKSNLLLFFYKHVKNNYYT